MTDIEKKKDEMENPSLLSIHIQLHIQETSPVLAFKEAFHKIL
jgi:hypothetical protein